ncbi:hypothetical protein KCU64_g44, partial [Aureobasidium melanogenum]
MIIDKQIVPRIAMPTRVAHGVLHAGCSYRRCIVDTMSILHLISGEYLPKPYIVFVAVLEAKFTFEFSLFGKIDSPRTTAAPCFEPYDRIKVFSTLHRFTILTLILYFTL